MLISINEKKQAFCRFTFLLSQKAHSKTLVFSYFLNTQSPLAWGRGLKPPVEVPGDSKKTSPLAWGRGLKLKGGKTLPDTIKSPLAWGRGLKHNRNKFDLPYNSCRPSRGGVD